MPHRQWAKIAILTPDAPRAAVEPDGGFGQTSFLDVVAIDNPGRNRFSFRIMDADRGKRIQELALYPNDQPGRFVMAVAPGTRKIIVEAHSPGDPLPARIEIRISTGN